MITDETGAICTGTFIRSNVVLTAGHCADGNLKIYVNGLQVEGRRFNPHYDRVGGDDVGVLWFTKPVSRYGLPVCPQSPRIGDTVAMIGFGNSDNVNLTGAGVKRIGYSIVTAAEDGMIKLNGASGNPARTNLSATGSGDSGGPLITRDGCVTGVVSGGHTSGDNSHSTYADLTTGSAAGFLRKLGL